MHKIANDCFFLFFPSLNIAQIPYELFNERRWILIKRCNARISSSHTSSRNQRESSLINH